MGPQLPVGAVDFFLRIKPWRQDLRPPSQTGVGIHSIPNAVSLSSNDEFTRQNTPVVSENICSKRGWNSVKETALIFQFQTVQPITSFFKKQMQ